MTATEYDLSLDQGADWTLAVLWKDPDDDPIDLTGYSAQMQVRSSFSAEDFIIELTDSDGITLGGVAGTLDLEISAATSSAWSVNPYQRWVYDLEVTNPGGDVVRLLKGHFIVSPEVTRDDV